MEKIGQAQRDEHTPDHVPNLHDLPIEKDDDVPSDGEPNPATDDGSGGG